MPVLIIDPVDRSDAVFGDAHQEWMLDAAREAPGRKHVHQGDFPGTEVGA